MFRTRRSRPQNKWLKEFILGKRENKAESLKVLKHVSGPRDDGTVVREVTDSQFYMNAEFTQDAIDSAQSADDSMQPDWDRALILVTKYELQFKFHQDLNLSNFILVIKAFKIWDYQIGFHLKNKLSHYLQDAVIFAKVREMWEEEKSRLSQDKHADVTDSSLTLTQLIGQMSQYETQPGELINLANPASPQEEGSPTESSNQNAGSNDRDLALSKVSNAKRYVRRIKEVAIDLLTEDFTVGKLQISNKDRKLLDDILEWKEDYIPSQSQDSEGIVDDLHGGYIKSSNSKQKSQDKEKKKSSSDETGQEDTSTKNSRCEPGNEHVAEDTAVQKGSHNTDTSQEGEEVMDTSTGQPSIHLTCSDESELSQPVTDMHTDESQQIKNSHTKDNQPFTDRLSQDGHPITDRLCDDNVCMDVNVSSPQENRDVHSTEQEEKEQSLSTQQNEDVKSLSSQSLSSSDPNNNSQEKEEICVTIVNDNVDSEGFVPAMSLTQRPYKSSDEENSPKFGPSKGDNHDIIGTLPFNPKLNTQEKQQLVNYVNNEDYTGTCPFSPNLSEGGACDCVNETVGSPNSSHDDNVKSSGESNQSLIRHFDLSPILASNSGDCHNHSVLVAETEQSETQRIQGLCEPNRSVDSGESPRLARLMQTEKDVSVTRDDLVTGSNVPPPCDKEEKNSSTGVAEKRKRRESFTEDTQSRKKVRKSITDELEEVQSEKNNEEQSRNDKLRRDSSENEIIESSDPSSKNRPGIIASVMNSVRAVKFFWSKQKDTQVVEDIHHKSPDKGVDDARNSDEVLNKSDVQGANRDDMEQSKENPNSFCNIEELGDLEETSPGNSKDISSSEESIKLLAQRSSRKSPRKKLWLENTDSPDVELPNKNFGDDGYVRPTDLASKSGKERCEEYFDLESRDVLTVCDRSDKNVETGGAKEASTEDSVMVIEEQSESQHGDSDVIVISSNSEPKEDQGGGAHEEGGADRNTETERDMLTEDFTVGGLQISDKDSRLLDEVPEASSQEDGAREKQSDPNHFMTEPSSNFDEGTNNPSSLCNQIVTPRKSIHHSRTKKIQQGTTGECDSGPSQDLASRLPKERIDRNSSINLRLTEKDSDFSLPHGSQNRSLKKKCNIGPQSKKRRKEYGHFESETVEEDSENTTVQQSKSTHLEENVETATHKTVQEDSENTTVQLSKSTHWEENVEIATHEIPSVEEESPASPVHIVDEDLSASSEDDMEHARKLLEELLHIPPENEVGRTLMSLKFPRNEDSDWPRNCVDTCINRNWKYTLSNVIHNIVGNTV